MQKENDSAARECRSCVTPVTKGCRRNCANQNIANNSPHQRRRKCQHHDAQKIEICGDGNQRAFHRKQKGTGQIGPKQKLAVFVDHLGSGRIDAA